MIFLLSTPTTLDQRKRAIFMRHFQGYINRENPSRGLDAKYGINFLSTYDNCLKQILLRFLEHEDSYADLITLIQKLPFL